MVGAAPIDDLLKDAEQQAANAVSINVQRMLDSRQKISQLGKLPVVKPKPIIVYREGDGSEVKPLYFANTINMIKGKSGEHKSRYAEFLATLFISGGHVLCDNLGHELLMPKPPTVVYLDTERDEESHLPYIQQCIVTRAGYDLEDDVEHLHLLSIAAVPRKQRVQALLDFARMQRSRTEGPIVIICDQIVDFITNMLDAEECLPLFDELLEVCKMGVTIFSVIHENPGTDKARGHIGTEQHNKSSTVIQVASIKDSNGNKTGNFRIYVDKNRLAENDWEITVRYDKASQGLVQVSKELVQAEKERSETHVVNTKRNALLNCLSIDLIGKTLNQKELFACIKARRQAKNEKDWPVLLEEISNLPEKYPVPGPRESTYRLVISKKGLANYYSLEQTHAPTPGPITTASTEFPADTAI